jgi:hypothetical protein
MQQSLSSIRPTRGALEDAIGAAQGAELGRPLQRYNSQSHDPTASLPANAVQRLDVLPPVLRAIIEDWKRSESSWIRLMHASEVMSHVIEYPAHGRDLLNAAQAQKWKPILETQSLEMGKAITANLAQSTAHFSMIANKATIKQDHVACSYNGLTASTQNCSRQLRRLIDQPEPPQTAQAYLDVCGEAMAPVLRKLKEFDRPSRVSVRPRLTPRSPHSGPVPSHLPRSGHLVGGIRSSR